MPITEPPERRRRSDSTKAAILEAARRRFITDGYERATIRAIAGDAHIDPAMVMRYFGNKENLFALAADVDLRLPDLTAVPRDEVGARLIGHLITLWDENQALIAILRSAVTNDSAVAKMREVFFGQVFATIKALHPGNEREAATRAGLCATQALGLVLSRYILRLPPVVALTPDEIVEWLGPTVQRYLLGD